MDYEQRPVPGRDDQDGKGSGLGLLWLLAPIACCGGPLIIGALAAAGALAWGALGLGLALATAGAVTLAVRLRRRSRACCPPAPAGPWEAAGAAAAQEDAERFPAR